MDRDDVQVTGDVELYGGGGGGEGRNTSIEHTTHTSNKVLHQFENMISPLLCPHYKT